MSPSPFYIAHAGADQLMVTGSGLAGAIAYYARLEDAAKRHKYVRTVCVLDGGGNRQRDALGIPFDRAPDSVTGYWMNGEWGHSLNV